jgi:hypothetical protein
MIVFHILLSVKLTLPSYLLIINKAQATVEVTRTAAVTTDIKKAARAVAFYVRHSL